MVDHFIQNQKKKANGFNITQCLRMFGVSASGYYSWKGRQDDLNGKQSEKIIYRNDLKQKMQSIIVARNGVIPGKRTFRIELFRRYGLTINTKTIAVLMKEMNIKAFRPHRDAYKHQASHNHICAAPENKVNQEFFIGPRKVILTDITYLYYGSARKTFYLCIFRDAYTRQNLGWSIDTRMNVALVTDAYNDMLNKHGSEFSRSSVFVHSDQGSQYLSTSFKQLLADDEFIQSVSARGNSQDNAPMESFFSRLKTDILDLVARCLNFKAAKTLVSGYLEAYNDTHYQYELAGLTPNEFFSYATTGIYPLDNYFGVPAKDMMSLEHLKYLRGNYADDEARKRREAVRKLKRKIDPKHIVLQDQALLRKRIHKWEKNKSCAEIQIEHLKSILQKTETALAFISSTSADIYEHLHEPLMWRNYSQLSYVFEMNELF